MLQLQPRDRVGNVGNLDIRSANVQKGCLQSMSRMEYSLSQVLGGGEAREEQREVEGEGEGEGPTGPPGRHQAIR